MKLVPLHLIQDFIRERGEWRSQYISDEQLKNFINQACFKFYSMVASLEPLYYSKIYFSTVTAGNDVCDLPNDFWRVTGVEAYDDATPGDGYEVLESFRWEERKDVQYSSTKAGSRWLIKGITESPNEAQDGYKTIVVQPLPAWSGVLKIDYIPSFIELDHSFDNFDTLNFMGLEWIICDVAIMCCAKEETDPSIYVAQKKEAGEFIKLNAEMVYEQQKTTSTQGDLQSLQRAVRNRGAWEREDISDAQLTAWINSSISALRDTICAIDPSYFVTYSDLSVGSGTREFSVPTDFFKLIGVDAYDSAITDGYQALNHFNWEERYDVATSSKLTTRFHLRGNTLYLQPTPTWDGTVRLEYIPTFTDLVNPSDTVSLYNNWQEWVVLDCCVKCAALLGKDPQVYMAQLQAVDKRVKEFVMRDLAEQTTPSSDSSNLRDMQLGIRARGSWTKEQVNDSQLTSFINSSIGGFVDLVARHDPSLYLSKADVTVVSGTKEYDLPTGFYKVQGVAVEDSSNPDGYLTLDRFNFDERYDFSYVTQKWETRYLVYGDKIILQPTPNWNGTVRVEFIPIPTPLSAPTDSFEFYNKWSEWVILDVCAKIAMLLDKNPQFWMAQKREVEDRIVRSAERDIGEPQTVVDHNRIKSSRGWWY